MKDSNILTLIKIAKESEKSQKERDAFVDFVVSRQSNEPRSLLQAEIENMSESVFLGSDPENTLEKLLIYLENEDGEEFLNMFSYENRRISTLLYEYKKTKKALTSFFELTIYKATTSSSSFIKNLKRFSSIENVPPMIGPMARPSDSEFQSAFRLDYMDRNTAANQLFRSFYDNGPLKLEYVSSEDNIRYNLFQTNVRGYIYRNINAIGTTTEKGSFCMIGFKGQNYNPSELANENCTFAIQSYSLDSRNSN